MCKYPIFIVFFLSQPWMGFCQKSPADKAFFKGNESYENNDFQKAIEYFTASLKLEPKPFVYFNRALAYFRIGDTCHLCIDLRIAAEMGDGRSKDLFEIRCLTIDTIYEPNDSVADEFPGYSFTTISKVVCDQEVPRPDRWNKDGQHLESRFLIKPEFPGGESGRNRFLIQNLSYPESAKRSGIQGIVYLSFVVEANGSISEVKILRGVSEDLDEESVRVVKLMPAWKPGTYRGKEVRVAFNMPVSFKLQ